MWRTTYNNQRYGRVICCIGVNPNKRYDVTPQTRAQILRDMISGSSVDDRCKNVQVEGTEICKHVRTGIDVALNLLMIYICSRAGTNYNSGYGLHLEICQNSKCHPLLSRHTNLVGRWTRWTTITNTKYMGTTIAWTISVANSNNFFGGWPKISSC